jgi:alpha-L-arabinofuranosidase
MIIKTLRGIGDAVYAWPIIERLSESNNVTVITKYPIIFENLPVRVSTDYNIKEDVKLSYLSRRLINTTNQYQDICIYSSYSIPFSFKWDKGFTDSFIENHLHSIIDKSFQLGKKICVIKEPCAAHMHKSKHDLSVAPNVNEMQTWVNNNSHKYIFISVGQNEIFKSRLSGIDFNLVDKMSVQDLITLCAMSDAIVSQVGHLVVLAQGFGKPMKIFYPENIIDKRLQYITPNKIEFKNDSRVE